MIKYIIVDSNFIEEHKEKQIIENCISINKTNNGNKLFIIPENIYYSVTGIKQERFSQEEKDMLEEVSNLISMSLFELEDGDEDQEAIDIEDKFNKWINEFC